MSSILGICLSWHDHRLRAVIVLAVVPFMVADEVSVRKIAKGEIRICYRGIVMIFEIAQSSVDNPRAFRVRDAREAPALSE